MPPAVQTMVAVGNQFMGSMANRRAIRGTNRMRQAAINWASPANVKKRFQNYNPRLYDAAYGSNPFSSFQTPTDNWSDYMDQQSAMSTTYNQNPLSGMFNAPGYIDPRSMNFQLNQNMEQSQSSQQAGVLAMGRSAFSGGMAAAFKMASRAMETRGRTDIMRGYDVARATKQGTDIAQSQRMLTAGLAQASGDQFQQADLMFQQEASPNWGQVASQTIASGFGAYGALSNRTNSPTGSDNMLPGGYGSGQTSTGYNPPSWTSFMGTSNSIMPAPSYTPSPQAVNPYYGG